MCPKEINGRLTAFAEKRKRLNMDYDLLAWLMGNYTHCDPRKYPRRPVMARYEETREEMTDDEMKNAMKAFMVKQNGDNT